MSVFKNPVRFILNLAGYEVVKKDIIRPLDLRNVCNSPSAVGYYSYIQQAIIESSPELGRGRPIFTFSREGINPFVVAAKSYLVKGTLESIREVLDNYYNLVQPKNASEIFSFSLRKDSPLNKLPAWSIVMPWDKRNHKDQLKHVKKVVNKENKQAGGATGIEDGWAWTGPANPEKIIIESVRLKSILDSIKKRGYQRHNGMGGDISVYIFMGANDKWCWQVKTGQHRATAVSVLGYRNVALRVIKILRREDVHCWPNVKNGLFTTQEALSAFDQVLTGEIPGIAAKWVDYARSKN